MVRKTQDAAVDAVTSWTETANKVTTQLPDFAKGYEIPGLAEFTKQFPRRRGHRFLFRLRPA